MDFNSNITYNLFFYITKGDNYLLSTGHLQQAERSRNRDTGYPNDGWDVHFTECGMMMYRTMIIND